MVWVCSGVVFSACGRDSSLKPLMVVGYHVVRAQITTAIRLLTGNSGCNGHITERSPARFVSPQVLTSVITGANPYQRFEEHFFLLPISWDAWVRASAFWAALKLEMFGNGDMKRCDSGCFLKVFHRYTFVPSRFAVQPTHRLPAQVM